MFRLFKEAQLVSKLDANELKILETARVALGKESIADLVEAFNPTNDDYSEWLRVIAEEGADRGINLNRKQDFIDLAFEVMENDPVSPPYEMQEMIVNKLWNDYKAARHGARIDKVVRAQEEEEALRSADEFSQSEFTDEEDCIDGECDDMPQGGDSVGDAFEPVDGEFDDQEGELSLDDVPAGADIEMEFPPEEGDGEVSLSDTDIDAIAARIVSQLKADDDAFGQTQEPAVVEPEVEEPALAVPAKEEEEKAKPKKTNLQQMLSGPRSTITQAQKEIEAEGEAAWKAHQVPSNPHPKKSIAYAAWERGMKRAAKTHFGFEEKAVVQPKKKK